MATIGSPPKASATTATPRSELALINAAQAGDELAFQRLLRHHHTVLEAQAARFYLPGADHDDVVQEARIAFANAVRGFRPDAGASFRSFAALCITRRLASAVTAARRHKHMALSAAWHGDAAEHAWASVATTADNPIDHALAHERRDELCAAATALSELERAVLAHALVDCSSGEAARRLGMSTKRADNALQRARRKVSERCEHHAA